MVELVTKPTVQVVAATRFDRNGARWFLEDHGAGELLRDTTPANHVIFGPGEDLDKLSEFAGRFCYRSWAKGRSSADYLDNILSERHGSVLAHGSVSFAISGVSRSLTHELVRHHVGTAVSQESQRFVTADAGEIEVVGYMAHRAVVPPAIQSLGGEAIGDFAHDYEVALGSYERWRGRLMAGLALPDGTSPTTRKKRVTEAARAFLPNAAETRLVWTMNVRAARNIIAQRGSIHADLEIRRLAYEFARHMMGLAPHSFQDMRMTEAADDGHPWVTLRHGAV